MPRYIDADEFKKKMECYLPEDRELALKVLKKVPTVDVNIEFITNELTKRISERLIQFLEANYEIIPKKPVVRCKDCKWYEETDARIGTCLLVERGAEINGFCAWGERKEE